MKFAYVDESGDEGQSDIFVMAGCLVDGYRLRRITADFDRTLSALLQRHPRHPPELKTKAFINGRDGWSVVPPEERKQFLRDICSLVGQDCRLFCCALSFRSFREAHAGAQNHPTRQSYWHAAAMFISSLIQKKAQAIERNKGQTVLVLDDNKIGMPALSDELYEAHAWYDGLYQARTKQRGKTVWQLRQPADRFDQIINTAFAIKSSHSSLVQVSDAVAFIFRRNLELCSSAEAYDGEREFFGALFDRIEPRRTRLGNCPDCEVVEFYRRVAPEGWLL